MKNIDINAVKKQVSKNIYIIFEFLIFFKPIMAPGILQIENNSTGIMSRIIVIFWAGLYPKVITEKFLNI